MIIFMLSIKTGASEIGLVHACVRAGHRARAYDEVHRALRVDAAVTLRCAVNRVPEVALNETHASFRRLPRSTFHVKVRSSHPRGVHRRVRSQITWASQYSLVARGT